MSKKQNTAGELKPKKRSAVRLFLGQHYYTWKRYLFWYRRKFAFAEIKQNEKLPFLFFEHKSLLLRQLKDVDMIYQYNKIINLKLAIKELDGIIIQPGETLSYWKQIGKPSKEKGYVEGMVLNSGSFGSGVGGGLCQLSNLIYWMTLHTPLTVVERYRHSFDVFPDSNRTLPFGSGATCIYPYRDVMIRNGTPFTFQLVLNVGSDYLEGEWRADHPRQYNYEIVEKNHLMKGEYWGGFSRHNQLFRRRYTLEGNFSDEEFIVENHAMMMYEPFLEN